MTVSQRQNLLQYLGYYDGRIDGLWGGKSADATREFQKDNGISSTGICDDKTDELLLTAVFHGKFKPAVSTAPTVSGTYVSKYFRREEFACKCGRHCNGFPVEPDEELLKVLDEIRETVGPVYVNSGIRCKLHNANEGGASNSRHLYGDAADIRCAGKTPRQLYDIACKLLPKGGVGLYSWGIHVDTRGYQARWTG